MNLDDEFRILLENWEDDAAHKRFLVLAESVGKIGEAGKLYRSVVADPIRKVRAEQGVQSVLTRALASLKHEAPTIEPSTWVRNVGIVLGVVMTLFALRALFSMM